MWDGACLLLALLAAGPSTGYQRTRPATGYASPPEPPGLSRTSGADGLHVAPSGADRPGFLPPSGRDPGGVHSRGRHGRQRAAGVSAYVPQRSAASVSTDRRSRCLASGALSRGRNGPSRDRSTSNAVIRAPRSAAVVSSADALRAALIRRVGSRYDSTACATSSTATTKRGRCCAIPIWSPALSVGPLWRFGGPGPSRLRVAAGGWLGRRICRRMEVLGGDVRFLSIAPGFRPRGPGRRLRPGAGVRRCCRCASAGPGAVLRRGGCRGRPVPGAGPR